MRTPVATAPTQTPYGLGLVGQDTPCGRLIGHTGRIPGYLTLAFSSEDGQRQAIVLVNLGIFTPPSLVEPLSATYLTVACGEPPPAGAAPLAFLDRLS
jgi:D-alanyl-D-alanine carboxypeptidase